MNRPKQILSILSLTSIVLLAASTLPAQTDAKMQAEPSYEAVLQVIVGVNDAAARSDIPQNLNAVAKQLRDNFSFSSYRLANTFIGRIALAGSFEYKSVSDFLGQPSESDAPTFLDWSLGSLRGAPDARGQNILYAQPFRFGARVPIKVGRTRGSDGQSSDLVNYEAVGLTMNRLSVPESRPTLIGTLSLPKTTGTLFLILTVRPTAN